MRLRNWVLHFLPDCIGNITSPMHLPLIWFDCCEIDWKCRWAAFIWLLSCNTWYKIDAIQLKLTIHNLHMSCQQTHLWNGFNNSIKGFSEQSKNKAQWNSVALAKYGIAKRVTRSLSRSKAGFCPKVGRMWPGNLTTWQSGNLAT